MKKRIMILAMVISTLFTLTACGGSGDSPSKQLTKVTWAALGNYMFAVDVADFDGDIFEPGTYRFYPDAVNLEDPTKTPIVWDIYVSNNLYKNQSELQESEHIATLGGRGLTETTIDLQSGQYVYVNYVEVYGEPSGRLQIEKQ